MSAHQKLTPQSAQDVTAKHTPGPWIVSWGESAGPDRILIQNESGVDVAEAFFTPEQKGCHTCNTLLIAAAPDLLEALIAIMPSALCGEAWGLPDTESVQIATSFGKIKAARAAIAKATAA